MQPTANIPGLTAGVNNSNENCNNITDIPRPAGEEEEEEEEDVIREETEEEENERLREAQRREKEEEERLRNNNRKEEEGLISREEEIERQGENGKTEGNKEAQEGQKEEKRKSSQTEEGFQVNSAGYVQTPSPTSVNNCQPMFPDNNHPDTRKNTPAASRTLPYVGLEMAHTPVT